jgi:hypothetical protein
MSTGLKDRTPHLKIGLSREQNISIQNISIFHYTTSFYGNVCVMIKRNAFTKKRKHLSCRAVQNSAEQGCKIEVSSKSSRKDLKIIKTGQIIETSIPEVWYKVLGGIDRDLYQ